MKSPGHNDLVFFTMTNGDLAEVLQLDSLILSPWSISVFRQHLKVRHNLAIVARHQKTNQLVGFLCGQYLSPELEIHKLAVCRQWRRQGMATALFNFVRQQYPQALVYLELRAANLAARKLYERLGFLTCGSRKKYYSSPPDDAIIMKLLSGGT